MSRLEDPASRATEAEITDTHAGLHEGDRIAPIAILYGALGLLPFWLPFLALSWPAARPLAASAQSIYAGVILSFLAGARFGKGAGPPGVLSLSMVGPVFTFGVLCVPGPAVSTRALLLALGIVLQGVWDVAAPTPPAGYRSLRIALTAGAASALLLGAWVLD